MNVYKKRIWILNGPNLNQLGTREPDLYGKETLTDIERRCHVLCKEHQIDLMFRQTNHEGVLIDWIQEMSNSGDPLLLNAGAYTHTSLALQDAVRLVKGMVIEVHLSNPYQRESIRQTSLISPYAQGIIAGFLGNSYTIAIKVAIESL